MNFNVKIEQSVKDTLVIQELLALINNFAGRGFITLEDVVEAEKEEEDRLSIRAGDTPFPFLPADLLGDSPTSMFGDHIRRPFDTLLLDDLLYEPTKAELDKAKKFALELFGFKDDHPTVEVPDLYENPYIVIHFRPNATEQAVIAYHDALVDTVETYGSVAALELKKTVSGELEETLNTGETYLVDSTFLNTFGLILSVLSTDKGCSVYTISKAIGKKKEKVGEKLVELEQMGYVEFKLGADHGWIKT